MHIMGIYAHGDYPGFVLALGLRKADRVKSHFLTTTTRCTPTSRSTWRTEGVNDQSHAASTEESP